MADEAPSSRLDVVRALREAGWTGLIAFGLLLPLIGFNTVQNIHNELVLETRWPLLVALVATVIFARLLWTVLSHESVKRRFRKYASAPEKLAIAAAASGALATLAYVMLG